MGWNIHIYYRIFWDANEGLKQENHLYIGPLVGFLLRPIAIKKRIQESVVRNVESFYVKLVVVFEFLELCNVYI